MDEKRKERLDSFGIPNYPGNSHKQKAESEKRVEKVVKGAVKLKPKTGVNKIADVFFKEDIKSVASYVVTDIALPKIKELIFEAGKGALFKALWGGDVRKDSSTRTPIDYVSYRNYSSSSSSPAPSSDSRNKTPKYDEIAFTTRGDAERVLAELEGIQGRYGLVRLADLYEAVGITPEHTYHKYGWTNVKGTRIESSPDGYFLKLPRAMPID
jgi:hypothetical protein